METERLNLDTALRAARTSLDPVLRAAVGDLPQPIRTIAGYHFGWVDENGTALDIAPLGKAIRPALVVLTAEAVSGTPGGAVGAAAATELVHNFTLIHDDVIDEDAVRRHRAAVWTVFGVPAAILAGDALLALAGQVLTRPSTPITPRAVAILNEAVQDLIRGQAADIAFESRTEVGLAECLTMAEGKTAALMACACELGAMYGGADHRRTVLLRRFGHHLGLAFQLVDDLLGIWGDSDRTGKSVRSDLCGKKKSLPVVAALTSGTSAGRRLAALLGDTRPQTEEDLSKTADLIEEAGGREWAAGEASRNLDAALSCLEDVGGLDPATAANLAALARATVHRDR